MVHSNTFFIYISVLLKNKLINLFDIISFIHLIFIQFNLNIIILFNPNIFRNNKLCMEMDDQR